MEGPMATKPDHDAEIARLHREFDSLVERIRAVERDLSNRDFRAKAPAEIVARQKRRRDELAEALAKVRRELDRREEGRE
jgi:valyl-tRNA synthetase